MLRNIIRFKGFGKGTSGGFLKPVSFRVQLTRCYRYDNGPSYRRFNNGEYSQNHRLKAFFSISHQENT